MNKARLKELRRVWDRSKVLEGKPYSAATRSKGASAAELWDMCTVREILSSKPFSGILNTISGGMNCRSNEIGSEVIGKWRVAVFNSTKVPSLP